MATSIEDYLEWCSERGKEPEKPYSGRLLVRATPSLHRAVAGAAARERQSVNAWVTRALERATGASESQRGMVGPRDKGLPRAKRTGKRRSGN
ncbi:MAG: type II toxin-antitoxin system HicB family antitoxin [Gemmatimonadota bacterium]